MTLDEELERIRSGVSCGVVLERAAGRWTLDKRESSRGALKYRRGEGEVVIVNHDGRGWWDPRGDARGDVFGLVQHLHPGLTFGQVRKLLRPFVGLAPSQPEWTGGRPGREGDADISRRWAGRPRLSPGSPAWRYLTGVRALPEPVLHRARDQDTIRDGAHGSAWFAHRSDAVVTHVEARGPGYKGSLSGGRKTLFRHCLDATAAGRIVVAEGAIDALSMAALEHDRSDTVYVATGGGMGPGSVGALAAAIDAHLTTAGGLLVSGADANEAGDRFAHRQARIAAEHGVRFERLRPPEGLDWNDVLVSERTV